MCSSVVKTSTISSDFGIFGILIHDVNPSQLSGASHRSSDPVLILELEKSYWAALSLSFRLFLISIMLMNIIAWGPQVRKSPAHIGTSAKFLDVIRLIIYDPK